MIHFSLKFDSIQYYTNLIKTQRGSKTSQTESAICQTSAVYFTVFVPFYARKVFMLSINFQKWLHFTFFVPHLFAVSTYRFALSVPQLKKKRTENVNWKWKYLNSSYILKINPKTFNLFCKNVIICSNEQRKKFFLFCFFAIIYINLKNREHKDSKNWVRSKIRQKNLKSPPTSNDLQIFISL